MWLAVPATNVPTRVVVSPPTPVVTIGVALGAANVIEELLRAEVAGALTKIAENVIFLFVAPAILEIPRFLVTTVALRTTAFEIFRPVTVPAAFSVNAVTAAAFA